MNSLAEIRDYFVSFAHVTEGTPFGPDVLVYKVGGKMFATLGEEDDGEGPIARTNLKCNPERAVELREAHESILPGYHMNKRHWNTVILNGSLSERLICQLVENSYELVFAGLTKKVRADLEADT